jgi:hypothetical protein
VTESGHRSVSCDTLQSLQEPIRGTEWDSETVALIVLTLAVQSPKRSRVICQAGGVCPEAPLVPHQVPIRGRSAPAIRARRARKGLRSLMPSPREDAGGRVDLLAQCVGRNPIGWKQCAHDGPPTPLLCDRFPVALGEGWGSGGVALGEPQLPVPRACRRGLQEIRGRRPCLDALPRARVRG